MRPFLAALSALALVAACQTTDTATTNANRQAAVQEAAMLAAPPMRWGKQGSAEWTQATLSALDREGVTILSRVPHDIATFCPDYPQQNMAGRRAFWAGLLSAVAKHESTYNPKARGGGGKWLGLMQIAPATWRNYDCNGTITDGADNMACAVKIMSRQVGRDNAVVRDGSGGWRGIARDWAPLRNSSKRADIAAWTSSQSYCTQDS